MRRGPLRRLPELTLALAVCALLLNTLLGEHPDVRAGGAGPERAGEPPVPAPAGSVPAHAALTPDPGPLVLRGPDDAGADGLRLASDRAERLPLDPSGGDRPVPVRPAAVDREPDVPTDPGPRWVAEVHEDAGVGRGGLRGRERHGPWTWHRADGSLALEGGYEDGRREGTWTWFDAEGHVTCTGAYREDRRQGRWTDLDRDGAVLLERHYRAGVLDGPWERNFTDGSPRERGVYVDGLREGPWRFYLPGGRVDLRTGTYRHGRKQPAQGAAPL